MAVNQTFDAKQAEANEFADEHEHALHVWVSEIVTLVHVWHQLRRGSRSRGKILHLEDHCVASTSEEHTRHNAVK